MTLRDVSVWMSPSRRAGDGSRPLVLAEALGWPFEVEQLPRGRGELLVAPPFGASVAGVRAGARDGREASWPDLVLSSGRENGPVARWVKRRSRGRTRIVHAGRPRGPSWLGEPLPPALPAPPDDLARAVARVRGVLHPLAAAPARVPSRREAASGAA